MVTQLVTDGNNFHIIRFRLLDPTFKFDLSSLFYLTSWSYRFVSYRIISIHIAIIKSIIAFLSNEILKMKLFFISVLFSISNANHGSGGVRGSTRGNAVERRSSVILFKPYVLDFVNSRAMAKLKKSACFPNLHYILSNNDFHYMGHLPVFRALFRERIPAFINFWKNLKLGPSATKGKIYSIKTLNCITQPVIALNVLFNEF